MSNQQHTDSIIETIATKTKFLLRVKVFNGISGLYKDLLVEIQENDDDDDDGRDDDNSKKKNLFDAIYDHEAVKKANVRKWNSSVIQKVKSGSHEIVCLVTVLWNKNDEKNENDDEENGERTTAVTTATNLTYSIEELKRTSARQLHQMLLDSTERHFDFDCDRIGLELQCVDTATATTKSETTAASKLPFHHPAISNDGTSTSTSTSGDGPSMLRCPFSGVLFDESAVLRQFQQK
jgi:hypothetical protein